LNGIGESSAKIARSYKKTQQRERRPVGLGNRITRPEQALNCLDDDDDDDEEEEGGGGGGGGEEEEEEEEEEVITLTISLRVKCIVNALAVMINKFMSE
jgi:hypothetical protein